MDSISKNHKMINSLFTLFLGIFIIGGIYPVFGQPKGGEMQEEKKYTKQECHKNFAVELNGITWGLLEKTGRTEQEDNQMINAAHASCYHWKVVGTDTNQQIGQWLISHVYAVLKRPEPALYHAKLCLNLTEKLKLQDWYIAYAYEAMARAYAAAGNKEECTKYLTMAEEAGKKIKNPEDKKLFDGDFPKGPWYGMK
jgi:hypothetical protein